MTIPRLRCALIAAGSLGGGALLTGCAEAPSSLDPRGPQAERIADVAWLIFALGAAVYVVVMALFVVAFIRGGRQRPETAEPGAGNRMIVVGGAVLPAVILAGLMVVTVGVGSTLTRMEGSDGLNVEVVGHQYWWEVRYPDDGVVTANEIHIPAGRPVRLTLTSRDVIHSFWVPQLAGKIDLIPGQTNTLWLEAREPGVYRGQCAEFCGVQHALMAFHVVADPPEQFDTWLAEQQRPAPEPADPQARRGLQIFLDNACSACHAIRGTQADGRAGPDLTHLATRDWLAAGTLTNNRANVASWITAAQAIKPGNSMPSFTDFSAEELAALLAYLESLQ